MGCKLFQASSNRQGHSLPREPFFSEHAGKSYGSLHALQVHFARDADGSKLLRMGVRYLDVKQHEALTPETLDQMKERNLGAVADSVEDRFPGKEPANLHTIDPSGQMIFQPALDAMSGTGFMKP